MGKHNGKARPSGLKVGQALVNRSRKGGGGSDKAIPQYLHTTDVAPGLGIQSVLERNDLSELMSMADLAGRDFAAEKQAVVIMTSAAGGKESAADAARRREAEHANRHRLALPRRPAWDASTTPEALDAAERASFLAWRRELARLEEEEGLVLTPFEKNLEVWRQLWRVLERSHVVVQVLDARDPLRYRSADLEAYAAELSPPRRSLLLLNKADLLPPALREAWAAYFERQAVDFVFWSAKAAADAEAEEANEADTAARVAEARAAPTGARMVGVEELLAVFERVAQAAVDSAGGEMPRPLDAAGHARLMVGLTGYPNVGKSSTINALFGSKKTAVAATPGKTKHFQTLNVTDAITLCDCPGLVLPKYADSKAEMVAAGVIPIDRLTDIRGPVAVVAQRIGRDQLQAVYNIALPPPAPHEDPNRPPTAAELLRAYAVSRGWAAASALPDETRAGRQILKDYTAGKLLYAEAPPGESSAAARAAERTDGADGATASGRGEGGAEEALQSVAAGQESEGAGQGRTGGAADSSGAAGQAAGAHTLAEAGGAQAAGPVRPRDQAGTAAERSSEDSSGGSEDEEGDPGDGQAGGPHRPQAAGGAASTSGALGADLELQPEDLDLMDSLGLATGKAGKTKRAEHKFHKKPARTKGNRGKNDDGTTPYEDGSAMMVGRRGGVIRVSS